MLSEGLFIQSTETDKGYLMCFSKIRNSNTTFIESSVAHLPINHGVYIDVFPLDYYPSEEKKRKNFVRLNTIYNMRIFQGFKLTGKRSIKGKMAALVLRVIFPSIDKVLTKRDNLYRSCSSDTMLANHGGAWGEKEIVPAEWYGEGVDVMFEGLCVKASNQYEKWLTHVYGDYMQLPPEDKRKSHHYCDIIDMQNPYTKYID